MRHIAIDTETWLIQPGLIVPRLACVTACDGDRVGLMDRREGVKYVSELLADDDVTLVGHNMPYDLAVIARGQFDLYGHEAYEVLLERIFRAYRQGRIRDTIIRAQLIDIAAGEMKYRRKKIDGKYVFEKNPGYNLAVLAQRFLGVKMVGKEGDGRGWRLRFAELEHLPIELWPQAAQDYAMDDAQLTLEVFHAEAEDKLYAEIPLDEEVRQTETQWALHLISAWGLRTDPVAVKALREKLERERGTRLDPTMLEQHRAELTPEEIQAIEELQSLQIYTWDKKGQRYKRSNKRLQARVKEAYARMGLDPPMTVDKNKDPGGRKKPFKPQIAFDKDVLLSSNDEVLAEIAELSETLKLLDTYVPMLEQGTARPICPRYDTLKETGRTSAHGTRKKKKKDGDNIVIDGTNIQNPPRKGGVRECFIPRDGHVFVACDYSVLELRTLAQVCIWLLGVSTLAEVFRRDEDPHTLMASQLLGKTYEETVKLIKEKDKQATEARQVSKPVNFGFPGGLGAEKFVDYVRGYDRKLFFEIRLDKDKAKELRDAWFARYPEMWDYFAYISHLVECGVDGAEVYHPGSGRLRGKVRFCATANGFFQGLAADLAKEALRNVVRECYVVKESPLYGSRVSMFIHDEIVIESPRAKASAAAKRLEQIMIEAGEKWCPDIPFKATAAMMPRWYKGADPVKLDGELMPWSPELVGALGFGKALGACTWFAAPPPEPTPTPAPAPKQVVGRRGDSKAWYGDCARCGKTGTWVICRPHPEHGQHARGLCTDCEFDPERVVN